MGSGVCVGFSVCVRMCVRRWYVQLCVCVCACACVCMCEVSRKGIFLKTEKQLLGLQDRALLGTLLPSRSGSLGYV